MSDSFHGINVVSQGSGPFAKLYSPTVGGRCLSFSGSATINCDKNDIVKNAENHIRTSDEYKKWICFLKESIGLTQCMVLGNVNDSELVRVEMHHFPLSLYEICWAIAGRQKKHSGRFSSCTIADEALGAHFAWQVGVVPLSTTIHQLHHSHVVPLSLDMVWGNWRIFEESYREWLPRNTANKIHRAGQITYREVAEIASRSIY